MITAEDLAAASLTAGLTEAQRDDLLAVAREVPFGPGDELFVEGEPAELLWMLLEGEIQLSRRSGGEDVVVATMANPGQWAGGLQAWSGDGVAGYRGTGRATSDGRALTVPSTELARLVDGWFPFGKHLLMGIYGTVRGIEAMARQRDSLVALGTMAAGLAHEINNPAAASIRAVEALRTAAGSVLTSLLLLAHRQITAEQYVALDALRLDATGAEAPEGGALVLADAEEAVGSWLDDRGVPRAWNLAATLAAAGVDRAWCERVQATVGDDALSAAVEWIAATLVATTLLDEIEETTTRISELVTAVRSYSQVDRASRQDVDVREGLDSTLTMLAHKLRDVEVARDDAPDLPTIVGSGGELNQVWTNLIDNAIDAMGGVGTLRIATRVEDERVVVAVSDTGGGMSDDVLARVFEPFFTTKDVGKGTGLGLDISRRIIQERHGGEITFTTGPDGTTATVTLPLGS